MYPECEECLIRQMGKLVEAVGLGEEELHRMEDIARSTISEHGGPSDIVTSAISYGDMWERISPIMGTDNPYKEGKKLFNDLAMDLLEEARAKVRASDDPLRLALQLAAAGNFIDFGAGHMIEDEMAEQVFEVGLNTPFTIDDTADLLERIPRAKNILYIGDNCGEIVMDRVLLEEIARQNPEAELTYVVRGVPVLNDVILDDAEQVRMSEVARVITNGSTHPDPATVMVNAGDEFKRAWEAADLIIAKGQGNLEGLHPNERPDLFFVLMAKCDVMARICDCEPMQLVCMASPNRKNA